MPFKPPALDLGLSLGQSTTFDAQVSFPSLRESLQISGGMVSRVTSDEQYSMEICENDLKLLSILGSGASSKVYKALLCKQGQSTPPKFVAVKKICNLDEALQKQMKKDVKVLMDANHARDGPGAAEFAGLVKFEGAYLNSHDQEVAIVLEYMDAGSLEDVKRRVKRIPEPQLARIMLMALKGLFFLHKHLHIVHRDIKPANLLLSSDGTAKIADFGIARSLDSTQAMCNTFMGSFAYMAPERFNGQPYGFSSDVWSLGLCVVECVTGKYPYEGLGAAPVPLMLAIMNNPVPLPPEGSFSDELRDFCTQCLHKDPAKRATALQLLSHPWILKHSNAPVDMAGFLGATVDPHKVFDEIAYFFTHQYYQMLSVLLKGEPREAAMAVECLKGLYTESSVYSMVVDAASHSTSSPPRRPRGKTGIAAKILETMTLFKAWGAHGFEMKTVDSSVVPGSDGSVLIMVQGEMAGGRGAGKFSDMFLLCSTVARDGERCFTISNQAFALM